MKHENVDLECKNYPNWSTLVHPNFNLITKKDFYEFLTRRCRLSRPANLQTGQSLSF